MSEAVICRIGGGGSGASGKALCYGDTNGEAGKFDTLTSAPTATTPLRYNGVFRATKVFGVYFSDSADLAESYYIDGDVNFGDLVMVDADGKIVRNNIRDNARILGFVSDKPGFILGGEQGVPIALSGRVMANCESKVKVGDFLAAGNNGKVYSVDIKNATRGSIVGIALSDSDEMDQALVFVMRF